MMKSFQEYLEYMIQEGVNDPGIFKAFFTAGGPGSGKSAVASRVGAGGRGSKMSPHGLKVVDSDPAFQLLLKRAGMAANPENIDSPEGQALRDRAKSFTKRQQSTFLEGRLGLLIDGTGKDYGKIKKMSDALRNIGYDTYMLFVNTALETAIERDKYRERVLGPERVTTLWNQVQKNLGKFQSYFGRENFILIDNNKSFEDNKVILDKMFVEIGKLIHKPPTSRAAHAWMKSQRPQMR